MNSLSCKETFVSVSPAPQLDGPFSLYALKRLTSSCPEDTGFCFISFYLALEQKFSMRSDLFIRLGYHISCHFNNHIESQKIFFKLQTASLVHSGSCPITILSVYI